MAYANIIMVELNKFPIFILPKMFLVNSPKVLLAKLALYAAIWYITLVISYQLINSFYTVFLRVRWMLGHLARMNNTSNHV